jgi:hypothetical protein
MGNARAANGTVHVVRLLRVALSQILRSRKTLIEWQNEVIFWEAVVIFLKDVERR